MSNITTAQITESTVPQLACGNCVHASGHLLTSARCSVRDAKHIYYRPCLLLSSVLRVFRPHDVARSNGSTISLRASGVQHIGLRYTN